MTAIEKKSKRYLSNITDDEWISIATLLPGPVGYGHGRKIELREVVDAAYYGV
jgi:hypothetical protein